MDYSFLLSRVEGNQSVRFLDLLEELAGGLQTGSLVVDLWCGAGRSAITVGEHAPDGTVVLAVDTFIKNTLSSTPYEDGNMIAFLNNVKTFIQSNTVIPLVTAVYRVPQIVGKKTASMIIIDTLDTTSTIECIDIAKQIINRTGLIVLRNQKMQHLFDAEQFLVYKEHEDAIVFQVKGGRTNV